MLKRQERHNEGTLTALFNVNEIARITRWMR